MIEEVNPEVADSGQPAPEICTWAREKCLKQPVQTANRKQKYHSSHPATGLFIAENATRIIDQRDSN